MPYQPALSKMMFLFPRWDILVPWRVCICILPLLFLTSIDGDVSSSALLSIDDQPPDDLHPQLQTCTDAVVFCLFISYASHILSLYWFVHGCLVVYLICFFAVRFNRQRLSNRIGPWWSPGPACGIGTFLWVFPKKCIKKTNLHTPSADHFLVGKPHGLLGKPTILGVAPHVSRGRDLQRCSQDPQEMIRPVGSPGYAAPEVIAVKPQRYNEKAPFDPSPWFVGWLVGLIVCCIFSRIFTVICENFVDFFSKWTYLDSPGRCFCQRHFGLLYALSRSTFLEWWSRGDAQQNEGLRGTISIHQSIKEVMKISVETFWGEQGFVWYDSYQKILQMFLISLNVLWIFKCLQGEGWSVQFLHLFHTFRGKVQYPDDEDRPVRPELMAIMQHLFLGRWMLMAKRGLFDFRLLKE